MKRSLVAVLALALCAAIVLGQSSQKVSSIVTMTVTMTNQPNGGDQFTMSSLGALNPTNFTFQTAVTNTSSDALIVSAGYQWTLTNLFRLIVNNPNGISGATMQTSNSFNIVGAVNEVLTNLISGTWGTASAVTNNLNTNAVTVGPGYKAYYNGGQSGSAYRIGEAYSLNGTNWYRDNANPVITPTAAWEGNLVKDQNVVIIKGVEYIYYSGYNGTNYQIGLATSTDFGKTILKYSGNPIITNGASGSFDQLRCNFPVVIYDTTETNAAKIWKMWYKGRDGSAKETLGYAYSADGKAWTKFGQVLNLGTPGSFDDNLLETGGSVVNINGLYYLFYGGNHSFSGRTQWGGGLVTFTDPQGTYTRQGQILTSLTNRVAALTVDTSSNTTSVTVGTTANFQAGEYVILASSNAAPMLTQVASIGSSTNLTLRDGAKTNYVAAQGAAIRSVYSWSCEPNAVFLQNGVWSMSATLFQQYSDFPGILTELSGWAYNTNTIPTGAWTFDMTRGVSLEWSTNSWDTVSAENFTILPSQFFPYTRIWPQTSFSGNGSGITNITQLSSISTAPTIVTNAGAGIAGATASITGNGIGFRLTINTGLTPTVNTSICTVTYATPFPSDSYPVIWPGNAAAAALTFFPFTVGNSTGFTLNNAVSLGLSSSNTYIFNGIVSGQ